MKVRDIDSAKSNDSAVSSADLKQKHSTLVAVNRWSNLLFDVPVAFLILALAVAGIAIGLSLFFVKRKEAEMAYRNNIKSFAVQQGQAFETDFAEFLDGARAVGAQFETYYTHWDAPDVETVSLDKFNLFLNRSQLLKSGYTDFTWIPRIKASQLLDYYHFMHTKYPFIPYTNFSAYAISDLKKLNPLQPDSKNGTDFFILSYIYPFANNLNALGYDPSTESSRRKVIFKAIETDDVAMTTPVQLSRDNSTAYQVYIPIWSAHNKTENVGVVRGVLRLSQYLTRFDINDYHVKIAIFDDTEVESNKGLFLYTTLAKQTVTRSQVERMAYSYGQSVAVADRIWTIYYIPSEQFFDSLDRLVSQKWIGLFVPLAVALVLIAGLGALLFLKKFVLSTFLSTAEKEQKLLVDHGKRLEELLDKIAIEEHRFRSIINTITYSMMIVTRDGRWLDCNKIFLKKFGLSKKQLETTSFSALFPDYASPVDLYNTLLLKPETIISMKSTWGQTVSTEVSMSLLQYNMSSNAEDDGIYIIVLDNSGNNVPQKRSVRLSFLPDRTAEQEYEDIINDPDARAVFKQFCIQHHNQENIMFIESVQLYKSTEKTHERVAMQEKIVARFLTVNAKYELNIAQQLVNSELSVLTNGLGQVDCFDNIYKIISGHLFQEAFPLYRKTMTNVNDLVEYI